jgi:hypothetical protein
MTILNNLDDLIIFDELNRHGSVISKYTIT